ncbi:MAG: hypothetical protein LBS50_06650 [Prevotellaceae bacterium]|jgi:tetratricopeptide (TPR) repeat protein|nr:hypothetical protein [Prevotellaceae bacterium]
MKKNLLILLFCSAIQSGFAQTPLYSQGGTLIDSGKSAEAVEILSQSIENREQPEWIPYLLRAIAYANTEKFVSAFDDIQKSLQYANANKKRDKNEIHSIYAVSSDIYKAAGNFRKSLESLNLAIKTSPDKAVALKHTATRGEFFYIAGDFRSSIADYNAVLKANPNDVRTKLAICRSIISEQEGAKKNNKKELEKSLALIDEVLMVDNEYAAAYKFRIRTNLLINNNLQAINDAYTYRLFFKTCYPNVENGSEFSYAENLFLHCAKQDSLLAKKVLLEQISKTPKNPLPYFLFSQYYAKIQENYELAAEFITKTINNATAELDLLLGERAQYYYNSKMYENALADLHLCRQMNDSSAYFHYLEALSFFQLDSLNAAVQSLGRCIELMPKVPDAYILRANAYRKMKKFDFAQADLDTALKMDTLNLEVLDAYAYFYMKKEDRKKSNEVYTKILNIILKDTTNYNTQDVFYYLNSDYKASIYNNISYNLVKLGEYEQAEEFITMALELNNENSFYLDTRGELYFCVGKFQECITDMNRAIELAEKDKDRDDASNSYFYRGRAKLALGQTESGNADIQKAAEMKHEEAVEFMRESENVQKHE